MGYTMSFDASVKLKKGNAGGLSQHIARDVLEAEGRTVNHSNPNIDKDYTSDNMTLVYNRDAGEFKTCRKVSEITDAVEARLSDVKRPLRKDAVVMRPLIIQLDPEWYEEHDEDEWADSYDAMADWLTDTFGAENLAYISVHVDEDSPHIHAGFVPVTEDGRLSQKDWFSSPSALRAMHDDLRDFMRSKGYDIDKDRKKSEKYVKRLSEADYRELKAEQEKAEDVARRERSVKQWQSDVVRRDMKLSEREKRLKEGEAELQRRQKALSKKELELSKKETALNAREGVISDKAEVLKAREAHIDALIRQGVADGIKSYQHREARPAKTPSSTTSRKLPSRGLGE
jgi:hypothetical protein